MDLQTCLPELPRLYAVCLTASACSIPRSTAGVVAGAAAPRSLPPTKPALGSQPAVVHFAAAVDPDRRRVGRRFTLTQWLGFGVIGTNTVMCVLGEATRPVIPVRVLRRHFQTSFRHIRAGLYHTPLTSRCGTRQSVTWC